MNAITENDKSQLRSVIGKIDGPVDIIIAQIDPDALGAAYGIASVIQSVSEKSLEITFFYAGSVSHAQNKTLVNHFGLSGKTFQPISKFRPQDNHNVVLVDSSQTVDARLGRDITLNPIITIDHHREATVVPTEKNWVWVDTEVGAASTLVVEIMLALNLKLEELERHVLPLLSVGIHSDTNGLVSAGVRDLKAYGAVAEHVDTKELSQVFNYPLPESYYRNFQIALDEAKSVGGRLVSNIGKVSADEGDDLSSFAEMFIRKSGTSLVVLWCIIGKMVRVSARCTDNSLDLNAFLKERFGEGCGAKMHDGKAAGGGTIELTAFNGLITPRSLPKLLKFLRSAFKEAVLKNT